MLKIIILSTLFLSSCSGTGASYRPIVDTENPNYEKDLKTCQNFARQYKYLSTDNAVDAGVSTAAGGVIGSILGDSTRSTLTGAAIGATFGAVKSGLSTKNARKDIIKRCLINRGYAVLK